MRYFIVAGICGLHSFDMQYTSNSFPKRTDIVRLVNIEQSGMVVIYNIIELSEEDYKSYLYE